MVATASRKRSAAGVSTASAASTGVKRGNKSGKDSGKQRRTVASAQRAGGDSSASASDNEDAFAAAHEVVRLDGSRQTTKNPVLYIGHVPFGFFEKEMRGFFEQFGDVRWMHFCV